MTGSDGYVRMAVAWRPTVVGTLQRMVFPPGPAWALVVVGPAFCVAVAMVLGLPAFQFAALVIVPTPLLLSLLVVRERRLWEAQEAILWPLFSDSDYWRRTFGGRPPTTRSAAGMWLRKHPEGSAPPWTRAALLMIAGHYDEARAAISQLPLETAHDRYVRLDLEMSLEGWAGHPLDMTAVDQAIRADTESPQVMRDLHLAYHAALTAVQRGGDGLAPLTAARGAAGRMPNTYRRQILIRRYRYVGAAVAVGLWLLAALLVGMATSGGVVWF